MFVSRVRLGWALAVVVVLSAGLLPAAGATPREIQPSPSYANGVALRQMQHQRQNAIRSIKSTNPWSAYNPAHDLLLQLQLKKEQQNIKATHPFSPNSTVQGLLLQLLLKKEHQQRQQHEIRTVQPNIRR